MHTDGARLGAAGECSDLVQHVLEVVLPDIDASRGTAAICSRHRPHGCECRGFAVGEGSRSRPLLPLGLPGAGGEVEVGKDEDEYAYAWMASIQSQSGKGDLEVTPAFTVLTEVVCKGRQLLAFGVAHAKFRTSSDRRVVDIHLTLLQAHPF